MNRLLKGMLAALMVTSLAACSSEKKEESGIPEGYVTITVNTEGMGTIAVATEGEELNIDTEKPITQTVHNVPAGTELTLGAKGTEGYQFTRWTKDGADFSEEDTVKVTADADAEYVAVFKLDSGWDGESVTDINDAKVIGDILGLPALGCLCASDKFVTAFELNGVPYRVIADIDSETYEKISDVMADTEKLNEVIKDLEIKQADNLNDLLAGDDELAALAGKTGADLIDAGWTFNGYDDYEKFFYGYYGVGLYKVFCEGEPDAKLDGDAEKISSLTVKSVEFMDIGDFAAGLEFAE